MGGDDEKGIGPGKELFEHPHFQLAIEAEVRKRTDESLKRWSKMARGFLSVLLGLPERTCGDETGG